MQLFDFFLSDSFENFPFYRFPTDKLITLIGSVHGINRLVKKQVYLRVVNLLFNFVFIRRLQKISSVLSQQNINKGLLFFFTILTVLLKVITRGLKPTMRLQNINQRIKSQRKTIHNIRFAFNITRKNHLLLLSIVQNRLVSLVYNLLFSTYKLKINLIPQLDTLVVPHHLRL